MAAHSEDPTLTGRTLLGMNWLKSPNSAGFWVQGMEILDWKHRNNLWEIFQWNPGSIMDIWMCI